MTYCARRMNAWSGFLCQISQAVLRKAFCCKQSGHASLFAHGTADRNIDVWE